MGEIKSTWELVMERLKEMKVTEEDKEQFQKEEERERAKRLFFPYFEGDARDWDGFKEQVKGLGAEGRKALLDLLSGNLSLERGISDRYMKGLEVLFGQEGVREVDALFRAFREKREKEVEALKAELLKAFEKKGLKGTAIDPNPRLHPRWTLVIEELDRGFRRELRELLDRLPLH